MDTGQFRYTPGTKWFAAAVALGLVRGYSEFGWWYPPVMAVCGLLVAWIGSGVNVRRIREGRRPIGERRRR